MSTYYEIKNNKRIPFSKFKKHYDGIKGYSVKMNRDKQYFLSYRKNFLALEILTDSDSKQYIYGFTRYGMNYVEDMIYIIGLDFKVRIVGEHDEE